MGGEQSQLNCCRDLKFSTCDACTTNCQERCSSVCFGPPSQKKKHAMVQSVNVQESSSGKAEAYPMPITDTEATFPSRGGGRCCGCLAAPQKEILYALPSEHRHSEQAPMNFGARKALETLEDECRFNEGKVQKIQHLSETYSEWRPVRGDGNCYYRTVGFGILEASIASPEDYEEITHALALVEFGEESEQLAHQELLQHMRLWTSVADMESELAISNALDQALIRACRRLVRMFLTSHKARSGMSYEEIVQALEPPCKNVEEFCATIVDPMGRDAESLVVDALPMQLGIGVRLWILDRREEVPLTYTDIVPTPDSPIQVHVLFKPGHYDLLYLRPESSNPA